MFVSLGHGGQISPAQWLLASASLFNWAGERATHASDQSVRVTFLARGPITAVLHLRLSRFAMPIRLPPTTRRWSQRWNPAA